MERLLAIGAPSLEREAADGSTLRVTLALFDALRVLCPFTEAVRPGLFVLPTRGPSRFFGGEDNVLSAVADIVTDATGEAPQLGVADGLFCAELAARAGVVVAPGGTDQFRARQPVEVLGSRDLAQTAHRLGLHTVGDFAALPPGRVAERFDRAVRHRHLVARGEVATLEGQRDPTWEARLTRLREGRESPDEQLGFFGQRGAGDLRAEAAARRVRHRLGAAAIVVASVGEGRTPADRGQLVPWGSPEPVATPSAPWPNRLSGPAPVTTPAPPVEVDVYDAQRAPVRVGVRGSLSGDPASVRVGSRVEDVTWWAGPWPTVERWWSQPRRRAHVQVIVTSGAALLLAVESGRWWLTGVYD